MPNLSKVLQEQLKKASTPPQDIVSGQVVGYDRGRVLVATNEATLIAETGLNDPLKKGDRVLIVVGRGTAKIIGFQGKDEAKF